MFINGHTSIFVGANRKKPETNRYLLQVIFVCFFMLRFRNLDPTKTFDTVLSLLLKIWSDSFQILVVLANYMCNFAAFN